MYRSSLILTVKTALKSVDFSGSYTDKNKLSPFFMAHGVECGPVPNVMAALPNIGGALCSTPQSLADAQYWSAVQ